MRHIAQIRLEDVHHHDNLLQVILFCYIEEHKDIIFYETHSSKPRLSDVLVHRSFFRHFSFTVHPSLLIAHYPSLKMFLCLILLARFAQFA